jgi:hypothetical protein
MVIVSLNTAPGFAPWFLISVSNCCRRAWNLVLSTRGAVHAQVGQLHERLEVLRRCRAGEPFALLTDHGLHVGHLAGELLSEIDRGELPDAATLHHRGDECRANAALSGRRLEPPGLHADSTICRR